MFSAFKEVTFYSSMKLTMDQEDNLWIKFSDFLKSETGNYVNANYKDKIIRCINLHNKAINNIIMDDQSLLHMKMMQSQHRAVKDSLNYIIDTLNTETKLQDEYSKERERSCNLDNKAGLFATIIIAIITLHMQIIPLSEIVPAYIKATKWQCTALTIILGIMGLGLSCFVAAFVDIYRAIKVKPFNRVNFDNLTSVELLAADPNKTAEAMIRHYRQIVAETNVKIRSVTKRQNTSSKGNTKPKRALDRNNKTIDIEKGSMSRYGLELAPGVPIYEGTDQ